MTCERRVDERSLASYVPGLTLPNSHFGFIRRAAPASSIVIFGLSFTICAAARAASRFGNTVWPARAEVPVAERFFSHAHRGEHAATIATRWASLSGLPSAP